MFVAECEERPDKEVKAPSHHRSGRLPAEGT